MSTTIQVSDTTKQMLEFVRKGELMKTYDALIRELLRKHTSVPQSMFGAAKSMKKWNKQEDMLKLHEL